MAVAAPEQQLAPPVAAAVAVDGNRVYVRAAERQPPGTLSIYERDGIASYTPLGIVSYLTGGARDLIARGRYVFAAGEGTGLVAFDVADPLKPTVATAEAPRDDTK